MEIKTQPPYIAKIWMEQFLELIQRVKLSKVDNGVVAQYNLTAPGNESKLVSALKFLEIVGDDGIVKDERIRELRMEGDVSIKALQNITEVAYNDLFLKIDIEKAEISDLRNYFIGDYGYSGSRVGAATTFFLYLCEKAHIVVSESLKNLKKRKSKRNSDERPRKKKQEKIIEQKKSVSGGILIKCNINESFEPKTKEELDVILSGNVFQALRLLLPEQKKETHIQMDPTISNGSGSS